MAARDSDDDIRKYLPDLTTILRDADPARAKEKLEKAQDNPELDAALAHAQRPSVRPSDASPWVTEPAGSAAVALTSERVPPPVVVVKEPETRRRKRAPFPTWAKVMAAVIAVLGPVTLLWVLLVRPRGQGREEPVRAGASAGTSVPAVPTTSASASATASAIETAPAPAPVLTVKSNAGASVAPLVPSPSSAAPTKPKGHPTTREDPYAAAPPGSAKTTEPVAPPIPAVTIAPTAPPKPPASTTPFDKPNYD